MSLNVYVSGCCKKCRDDKTEEMHEEQATQQKTRDDAQFLIP